MLSSCRKLGCEMNSRRLKFSNPLPSRKEARQDGIIYWCKAINPNCQRESLESLFIVLSFRTVRVIIRVARVETKRHSQLTPALSLLILNRNFHTSFKKDKSDRFLRWNSVVLEPLLGSLFR